MGGMTLITQGIALHCASQMQVISRVEPRWAAERVIFRAGSLMPSDLFASPSLREAVSYVTIGAVAGGYEGLATPLGSEWHETHIVPPAMSVGPPGSSIRVERLSSRKAPGIVALIWEKEGGKICPACHVVQDDETAEDVVQALASQLDGVRAEGVTLSVAAGRLEAQIAGYGRSDRLVSRQSQVFRLSVWTDRCALRGELGQLLLERILPRDWLDLADGRRVQLWLDGEEEHDGMQTQALFRRDIRIRVIWDRWESIWSPQMIAGGGLLSVGSSVSFWGVPADTQQAEIPVASLAMLTSAQDMPVAYRDWCVDCDGTVSWVPVSAGESS